MADKTDKKPGFVARAKNAVKNFTTGVAKVLPRYQKRAEEGRLAQPEDTRKNTIVVLVVVILAALILFILDAVFGGLLGLVIGG